LLILVLALGIAFDLLFWKQSIGINFGVFVAICVVAGATFLTIEGYRPSRTALLLVIPTCLFVLSTFVREEPLTRFLAFTFTFFLLGVFASSYLRGRWPQYNLTDYAGRLLDLIGSTFSRQLSYFNEVRRLRIQGGQATSRFPATAIFRGVLIALPIVVFFTVLLASADAVFNQRVGDFFDLFHSGKLVEYSARIVLILVCSYLLAGAFLHAARRSRDEDLFADAPLAGKRILGITESSIVMVSITALFLLFVIIQFQYFFGGQSNIGVEGFTYSEYARRGFNELVSVGFFSLLLIMGLGTFTKRDLASHQRVFSALSVAILLEVLVILISAFQRLTLAIDWHGFSRLRLYPQVFLIWVAILFVVIVVLEIRQRERYFTLALMLAALGFAVSLTLVNVDNAIVEHNFSRVLQGKNLNVGHFVSLSTDAIPAIVRAYETPGLSEQTREGLGAVLFCYIKSDRTAVETSFDWRSFNYSRWRAASLLKEMESSLTGYRVSGPRYALRVRGPSNAEYECYGEY
jgi:hypothetical protein